MAYPDFDSLTAVIEHIRATTPVNPLGTDSSHDQWEWMDWGDEDGGRIMPSLNSPFISPYLYRGQIRRYSPCLPSVYRGFPLVKHPQQLSEDFRDSFLLSQTRLREFCLLLEDHPAVRYAAEIGLHLNSVALAQHYGLATDHMDLTADPEVAAFFASCRLERDGSWYPLTDGVGIIYRFDFTVFARASGDSTVPDLFRVLEMIGLQTLPRPGEQKAWTIRLPLGFDFERLPLEVFSFRHTEEASRAFHQRFSGGTDLFPPDVLADAAALTGYRKDIPQFILRSALLEQGCRPDMIDEAISFYATRFREHCEVEITDRAPLQLTQEQQRVANEVVAAKRDVFLKNVGVRPVKTDHVPTLIELLKDRRDWNRATAAKVLGHLGARARDALPTLRDTRNDTSEAVRTQVAEAIRAIESGAE